MKGVSVLSKERLTFVGHKGEVVEKYCKKGTKVNVWGEWTTGSYKNKYGNTVYTNDCNVSKLEFCESKAQSQQSASQPMPSNDNSWMDILRMAYHLIRSLCYGKT